jgi:FkbM family methyltransferase
MLFSGAELVHTFNVKPSGVLHVGAHRGEESSEYQKFGWGDVVWVEAQPNLARELIDRLPGRENCVIEAAVWDESGVELDFKIASNGQSSSLLDLGSHAENYPSIKYISSLTVFTKRLDEIIPAIQFANFLNMDIQGVELKALKGLGSRINEFKWVYTEVNKSEVYKDCTLIGDLDVYLVGQGFKRISTRWVIGKGWGDALYAKEKVEMTHIQRVKAISGNVKWIFGQVYERVQIRTRIKRVFRKITRLIRS